MNENDTCMVMAKLSHALSNTLFKIIGITHQLSSRSPTWIHAENSHVYHQRWPSICSVVAFSLHVAATLPVIFSFNLILKHPALCMMLTPIVENNNERQCTTSQLKTLSEQQQWNDYSYTINWLKHWSPAPLPVGWQWMRQLSET